jgi:hypothetical protein
VLENATRKNDFLFEHHWKTRPIRSWSTTVWRSLRPKQFWGQVSMHEDVQVAPLVAHFFLAITTSFAALHGSAWLISRAIYKVVGTGRTWPPTPSRWRGLAARLSDFASQPLTEGWNSLTWSLLAVAMPFVGALALLFALRQTMRRYRIRFIQLFRVVAYVSTPVCLWCALAYFAGFIVLPHFLHMVHLREAMKYVFAVFVWSVFSWYLARGFKQYLHLPHAALLGMTAAFVGLLALASANLLVAAYREGIWG